MYFRYTIFLASLCLLLATYSFAQTSNGLETEEYAVYSDWLKSHFTKDGWSHVFLMKRTDDYSGGYDKSRHRLNGLRSTTLKNFKERNKTQAEITDKFVVGMPLTLLPITLLDFMDDQGDYIESARKSGAEYGISLSRVGFDSKKNQALLNVDYKGVSTPAWTFGYYFLMVKKNNTWAVEHYKKSWEY